jgi:hypothetical protein
MWFGRFHRNGHQFFNALDSGRSGRFLGQETLNGSLANLQDRSYLSHRGSSFVHGTSPNRDGPSAPMALKPTSDCRFEQERAGWFCLPHKKGTIPAGLIAGFASSPNHPTILLAVSPNPSDECDDR